MSCEGGVGDDFTIPAPYNIQRWLCEGGGRSAEAWKRKRPTQTEGRNERIKAFAFYVAWTGKRENFFVDADTHAFSHSHLSLSLCLCGKDVVQAHISITFILFYSL